jgi:hypothetical protein
MKTFNEKDYIYMGFIDGWHAFQSNPNKKHFDKEKVLIEQARYVKENGESVYYRKKSS